MKIIRRFLQFTVYILALLAFDKSKASGLLLSDTAFIRTYGGINFEEFRDVIQTPDSGFMMAGITNGYGQGSNAIYVVKTTKDGTHMWSKALGGVATEVAYSIAADNSGNYFIAGTSSSGGNGGYDGYLLCLNTAGDVLWEKYYGGSDWDFLNSVAVLPDQSILIAGESYSFSDGGSDAWILHLNTAGDTTWTKHFGSSGNDAFKNICLSSAAIYLSGYVDSTDANGMDGFIVKLDFSGNEIWQKRFNNLGRDVLNGSLLDPSGNLIIYGSTAPMDSAKNDIWVEATDTNGVSLWLSNSGSTENDYANKVISVRNNTLVIIGQKDPSGFGNKSMFTAQYDAFGFQISSHSFGGANDEEGYSGIRTFDGGLALVGYTTTYGLGNKDAMLVLMRYDTTLVNGLVYIPTAFTETLAPIGINEIQFSEDVFLYPNPATSFVSIRSGIELPVRTVIVQDVLGKEIIPRTENGTNSFSTEDLQSGIYLVRIIFSDNLIYSGKMIVLK